MIVDVSFHALRDLKKMKPHVREKFEQELDQLLGCNSFSEIKCEKLKGYPDRFKLRVGNDRMVIKKLQNNHIQVTAIADRKDVYRRLFGITFF